MTFLSTFLISSVFIEKSEKSSSNIDLKNLGKYSNQCFGDFRQKCISSGFVVEIPGNYIKYLPKYYSLVLRIKLFLLKFRRKITVHSVQSYNLGKFKNFQFFFC
ncbi:hypothetical protein B9Z55_002117 [Caenorhabditis nigoni]|uniref:Uncharacterized protein n=1 Tax=Caenorhabditis nigoni TaxID=1611254 RepID=A0A2G5VIY7_9PELO|nr:hypothetical protein B9Z55_002117 [Caenorhabditis nigoni]